MEELIQKLKEQLIEALNLEEITPTILMLRLLCSEMGLDWIRSMPSKSS